MMEKIKIFCEFFSEYSEYKDMQKEVNKWLDKNPDFRIKNISTIYDDKEYILTVHYTVGDDILP